MSGNDGVGMAGPFAKCGLLEIEPQTRLAHLRVGTMATEAVARQNRLHILVEIQMLRAVCGHPGRLPGMAAGRRAEQDAGAKQPDRESQAEPACCVTILLRRSWLG